MCRSIIGGEYNCIITSKLVIQLTFIVELYKHVGIFKN